MNVTIEVGTHSYQPGDSISGTLRWQDARRRRPDRHPPDLVYIRKRDCRCRSSCQRIGSRPSYLGRAGVFFRRANYPCSYSGSLISVTWAIEAIVFPQRFAERTDLVIGPGAREISWPLDE